MIEILMFSWLFLLIFFTIYQYLRRLNLAPGLTDESFAIAIGLEQYKGDKIFNHLSGSVTGPLYYFLDNNLVSVRIVLILIVLVLSTSYALVIRTALGNSVYLTKYLMLISFLVILTIPSNFRYLLITPSYYVAILISTTGIFLLVYLLINRVHTKWILTVGVSFLIFTIFLSRISSGFIVYCTVAWTFYAYRQKIGLKQLYFLNLSCFLILLIYGLSNYHNILTNLMIQNNTKIVVGEKGGLIVNEVLDVLLIALQVLIVFWFFGRQANNSAKVLFYAVAFTFIIIHYNFRNLIFEKYLYAIASVAFIAVLFKLTNRCLPSHHFLPLCSLPITSQFGSHAPASAIHTSIVVVGLNLIVLSQVNVGGAKSFPVSGLTLQKSNKSKLYISLLLGTLTAFNSLTFNSNFETDLVVSPKVKDNLTGWVMSEERKDSIDLFRQQFYSNKLISKSRPQVLDLSGFNPGVLLYVDQSPYIYSTSNFVFGNTLGAQVKFMNELISKQSKSVTDFDIIARTESSIPIRVCRSLRELIADERITNSIVSANELYKEVAIYRSVRADLVYPKNIVYLTACKPT